MTTQCVKFDHFCFDRHARTLVRHGPEGAADPVAVGSRALEILAALVARPGELISKDELMRLVWPGVAVEENNLTVQISALRRALDDGRGGTSAIQTVPGRGYRFLPTLLPVAPQPADAPPPAPPHRGWRTALAAVPVCVALIVLGWQAVTAGWAFTQTLPTLSVVVLPLAVIGDATPDARATAAVLTEAVDADLGRVRGSFVVASNASRALTPEHATPAALRLAFGVRYLVAGSVSRQGDDTTLRLELDDTATSASLWSGVFKVACPGTAACADTKAEREMVTAFLDAEMLRLGQLPEASLSAADLMAEVRATMRHAVGADTGARNTARLERALQLAPDSPDVMIMLGRELLRPFLSFDNPASGREQLPRAEALADRARTIAPASDDLLVLQAMILRVDARWEEARAAFAALLETHPGNSFYANEVAICLRALGRPEDSAAVLRTAIAASPAAHDLWALQFNLATALFQLGRDAEAVRFTLAAMQTAPVVARSQRLNLAAEYALLGRTAEAARQIAILHRTGPWMSVRTVTRISREPPEGRRRLAEGLEKAGVPDHIDETLAGSDPATTGVRTDDPTDLTPIGAPGIATIGTDAFRQRIEAKPRPQTVLLLDCSCESVTLGTAVRGPDLPHGAPASDADRDRLSRWTETLTHGDRGAPIVVIGGNAARWDARNFAVSLAALGWRNVAWYRGGLDALEAANALPVD